MGPRPRRALLAAFLAAPLAVLGVCGPIAALAPPPAVCEAPPAGGCCPRSESPVCPRAPESGRCPACGAAAVALGETESVRAPARVAASATLAPAVVRVLFRTSAAVFEASLAASPPRHLLLATFRN